MSDLTMSPRAATRYRPTHSADDEWDALATGRHALDEDAGLTPIFHALRRGGWRRRQPDPTHAARRAAFGRDPLDEFRRDPLTAPIPVQALVPAPTRSRPSSAAHAPAEPGQGRHHRRREAAGGRW